MKRHILQFSNEGKTVHITALLGALLILAQLLQTGCASIQPPSGGPKDTTNPILVSSIPRNLSKNFQGQNIYLEFDEMIREQSLKKELLITPFPKGNFTTKLKKKNLTLLFDEPLDSSTTYTFNFRGAVVDVTEKNPVQQLKIIFSTGKVIDSLKVAGKVIDHMTQRPVNKANVMLFSLDDSLGIKGGKPMYLAETDAEGHYTLEYLKKGKYYIYALKEEDNNLRYNDIKEKIGFIADTFSVEKELTEVDFAVKTYDFKKLKLIYARSKNKYFEIKFNKPVKDFSIKPLVKLDTLPYLYSMSNREVITLYNISGKSKVDSIPILLMANDSIGNHVEDTSYLSFKKPKKIKPIKTEIKAFPKGNSLFAPQENFDVIIASNTPLISLQPDSIMLLSKTDTIPLPNKLIQNEIGDTIIIKDIEMDKSKMVYLKKGTMVSIEKDTLPSLKLIYGIKKEENYGLISGFTKTSEKSYIIQLLDEKFNVEEADSSSSGKFRFEYIAPGLKQIRVLVDKDNDGKWGRGSFVNKEQPEPVYIFQLPNKLRANWELLDIKLEF